jgi:hypothetical protein
MATKLFEFGSFNLYTYYIFLLLVMNMSNFSTSGLLLSLDKLLMPKATIQAPPPLPKEQGCQMRHQFQGLPPLPTASVGTAFSAIDGQGGGMRAPDQRY